MIWSGIANEAGVISDVMPPTAATAIMFSTPNFFNSELNSFLFSKIRGYAKFDIKLFEKVSIKCTNVMKGSLFTKKTAQD